MNAFMKPGISAMPATIVQASGIVTHRPRAAAQGAASTMDSNIQTAPVALAPAHLARTAIYQRDCRTSPGFTFRAFFELIHERVSKNQSIRMVLDFNSLFLILCNFVHNEV